MLDFYTRSRCTTVKATSFFVNLITYLHSLSVYSKRRLLLKSRQHIPTYYRTNVDSIHTNFANAALLTHLSLPRQQKTVKTFQLIHRVNSDAIETDLAYSDLFIQSNTQLQELSDNNVNNSLKCSTYLPTNKHIIRKSVSLPSLCMSLCIIQFYQHIITVTVTTFCDEHLARLRSYIRATIRM